MKSIIPALVLMLSGLFTATAQEGTAFFLDQPALTPDGETIIFTFSGDLWKVPVAGGLASRLTAMDGNETFPRVSPDGKWLAFSAQQSGNTDIYIMPLTGGEIKRLTYHEAADLVSNWSWDSETIYFSSSRYNRINTFTISVKGGTPLQLFPDYHHTVHDVAEHPRTGELFFNESWESSGSGLQRKGYKGDHNPDIQSYNPKSREYKKFTDWQGKDFGATIDRQGNIFFISDEYNGEYNLYTFSRDRKQRLTEFKSSIWYPCVSANGAKVAFRKDYQLFVFDVKRGRADLVDIKVPMNGTLNASQDFNVKGQITNFDISDDGKKLAFCSRGELFIADAKGKFVQQLPTRPDGRVLEVYWLKDNKTILFNQTVNGYQNWFTLAADGSSGEKAITSDKHNNRLLTFNSDKTKAVYLGGRHELRLLDLVNFSSRTLLRDEFWDLSSDRPQFGPDDQHILFTAYRNFERDILVHNLENGQTRNLTNTGVTESGPVWSPDGKYIYFTSNRTKPYYPFGPADANLYRMALQAYDEPYKSEKVQELFVEKANNKDTVKQKVLIRIDEPFLNERIEAIGATFGLQSDAYVLKKDDKTIVIYGSNHDEGRFNLWKTTLEPFEQPKTESIQGATTGQAFIRQAKNQYFVLINGSIATLNLDGNKAEPLTIEFAFRRQLAAEFRQMFFETWANLEQNFYDETFHGKDWAAIRDRYAAFLPHLNDRNDLRQLLNDMLGELNASHLRFTSSGGEEAIFYKSRSAGTGILFDNDDPYKVSRIVAQSPADKQGKDVQPGDRLVKVNGQPVIPAENREKYFTQPSLDEEIRLTFLRNGQEREVRLHPVSTFVINDLLYDEWEASCQQRVDTRGDKRIAYVHMKDMGLGSLDRFLREMVSEGYQRDALILDLRYNTGGNVHNEVLQFLSQRPYLNWKYREGQLSPQPNFAPSAGPIVLLVNEPSLSDAEMTTEGFKALKLGTVVGTETYRWIIFTSGKSLVDGSFYRLPSWGCYTLDGKDLELTGVKPDVYVKNTFKDRLEGKDPQLDKAIDLILQQLK